MTLIAGFRTPYLCSLTEGTPFPPGNEGVILAADSRFTDIRNGSIISDVGRKLEVLDDYAAICYTGAVDLARDCIARLKQEGVGSPKEVSAQFQRAWCSSTVPERFRQLSLLIGVYVEKHGARLWLFEHSNQFLPQSVPLPMWFSGPPALKKELETSIRRMADETLGRGGTNLLDPRSWILLIGAVFDQVALSQKSHQTVGGKLQIACVDSRGVRDASQFRLAKLKIDEVDGEPVFTDEHKYTLDPSESSWRV